MVPGEFLRSPELPPPSFLQKIENTLAGFPILPPHPPPALLAAEFVFVREDSTIPSLAPLYRGLNLVLERRDKFFRLQLGSRTDVVSVDRLKPAFSENPIKAALPSVRGWPALRPALCAPNPLPSLPFA